jgi:hypothetical protein
VNGREPMSAKFSWRVRNVKSLPVAIGADAQRRGQAIVRSRYGDGTSSGGASAKCISDVREIDALHAT